MLTQQENERLTRVGPGTPAGELLRRYWQPVGTVDELDNRWTKRARILGEDLVLYRDRSGGLGLITEKCPHRSASLFYGIPTEDGLRCAYHGWCFNHKGECTEQPNEREGSKLKEKIEAKSYPVRELGGLLFAYMGPGEPPILPQYDAFAVEGAVRTIGKGVLNCNWLQVMENSVDPVHTQWLHGRFYEFLHEDKKVKTAIARHQKKIAFDEFEFGIIKRRLFEGQSEDADDWKVGHPLLFPNGLAVGSGGGFFTQYTLQMRVPIDDTHTMHYWYHTYVAPEGVDVPQHLLEKPAVFEPPIRDDNGEYLTEYVHVQDIMMWETQGDITNRAVENLGSSDLGVITYRRMLRREIDKVENGQDPIGVLRDPTRDQLIMLPRERHKNNHSEGFRSYMKRHMMSFSPVAEDLIRLFEGSEEAASDTVAAG